MTTTTAKALRNCTECAVRLNKGNRSTENPELCLSCFEAAMAANDDAPVKVKWVRMSHKECGHPLTFKDREACRKAHRDASLIEGVYGDR